MRTEELKTAQVLINKLFIELEPAAKKKLLNETGEFIVNAYDVILDNIVWVDSVEELLKCEEVVNIFINPCKELLPLECYLNGLSRQEKKVGDAS